MFLLLLYLVQGATQLDYITVDPASHRFVDQFGRVRLFHGVNLVGKDYPHYRSDLLNTTKLSQLQSWGFNAVRTGVQWSGLEPKENYYNSTYANISQLIVQNAADYNIHTLVEFHQDVLSSAYCLYDAIPLWVVNYSKPGLPFPSPLNADAINCSYPWAEYYFTDAAGKMFQDIYDNHRGLLDKFTSFWEHSASLFVANPNVLGFELMNEPWCGNPYDPDRPLLCLDPTYAGANNLAPTWEVLASAIRSVSPSTPIFYEPVTWGYLSDRPNISTGFTHVPGGSAWNDRSVLSWHYYCYLGGRKVACDMQTGDEFHAVYEDIQKIGGGSFMTEWGYCLQSVNGTIDSSLCDFTMNVADKLFESWMLWDPSDGAFWDSNGNVNEYYVRPFVRPYARSIAGVPLRMVYLQATNVFELDFLLNTTISAPTEIYYNQEWNYPKGFLITACPELQWSIPKSNTLSFTVVVPPSTDLVNCTIRIV